MFKAWAYRILSNKCADWLRARVRHRRQRTKMENHAPSQPNETNRTPADDSENSDESTRLRRAMDQLTNEQRALLHLRYVEEMSVPMIADVFAIAEGTVKSRLHHLRETLRQQLAGHNENN